MKHSIVRTARAAGAALIFALSAQSCRDAGTLVPAAGALAPRSITSRVVVVPAGGAAVLTLVLDVRGDVGRIGSFTGRIRFDPAALLYESEVALSDGTMRASNPGEGVIRVAGASLSGVDVTQLAAFRFKVLNAAALSAVQFDLEEVHELTHANLSALVQRTGTSRAP